VATDSLAGLYAYLGQRFLKSQSLLVIGVAILLTRVRRARRMAARGGIAMVGMQRSQRRNGDNLSSRAIAKQRRLIVGCLLRLGRSRVAFGERVEGWSSRCRGDTRPNGIGRRSSAKTAAAMRAPAVGLLIYCTAVGTLHVAVSLLGRSVTFLVLTV